MAKKYILSFLLVLSTLRAISQDGIISLREAIRQLEARHSVTFSYADDLAGRLQITPIASGSLEAQLVHISNETGLQFNEVSKGSFLITLTTHSLCARIVNDNTNEPMEGAQVILNDNITNVIADGEGYVKFEGKLTFQDTISIKYFGFDTKKVVAGKLKKENCPEIRLVFGETTLREVMITSYITSGIDFSKEDHSLLIKTNDLALLPGETDGDILLAIKTLPGITSPDGKAGNLHFRGSTTDQTLVLFDNIPIYHKGHYFGAISPYNPRAVDEITVYRSGYGPDLGGRVGGAIELKSSKSIPDSALFGVGLNSYYGSAFAEVPIGGKLGISSSFRGSYPGEWQSPKLKALNKLALQNSILSRAEESPDQEVIKNGFIFQDANLTTNYKIKNGSLSLSLLNIRNLQEGKFFITTRNSTLSLTNKLNNRGANMDWAHYWGPKFSTFFAGTFSDYDYKSTIEENPADRPSFTPNLFENRINDLFLSVQGNMLLNAEKSSHVNMGYQINRHSIEDFHYSNRPNREEISIRNNNDSYLHSLFVNHQTTLGKKLRINSGIRTNHYTLAKNIRIEPRVFLNWQLKHSFSLKSSYGLYSQYITQRVYFDFEDTKVENLVWELASDEKPIIKSNQSMVGATWQPGSVLIDFELYHKRIDDLSTLRTGKSPTDPDRYTIGVLEAYGLDVLLKKKWGKLDTWISYSYTHTEMDFPGINLLTFETYYDQPHTLNINATMPYKNWSFSIGWQYLSGVPIYTNNTFFPVPGENPGNPPSQNEPVPAEEDEGRFPAQHQLDVALVYQFPARAKGWKGSIGLSFLNVYDKENLVAENYLTFGPNTSLHERYSIGFAPNIMVSINW